MSAPSFLHPEWVAPLGQLWLLLAAGAVAARLHAGRRARALLGGAGGGAGRGADLPLLGAALLVGLALVGPRIGTREERVSTSGVDVVLLLDVSRSMDARDVPPSRLDRARQAAAGVLARLGPGDRAALAAFASHGVVITPLSPDHAALAELLPALDTSLVRPAGSDLGRGVREAIGAFEAGSERPRVLVVLSDGEDADGRVDLGTADARRADARVVAVALGSEAGATIARGGLPVRDRRGEIVVSRADPRRLAALAEATGGDLLGHDALGRVDLEALTAAVRRDAPAAGRGEPEIVSRSVPAVRVAPFAAMAFLILALGGSVRLRRAAPVVAVALAATLALGATGDGLDARRLLAADGYFDAGVAALRADRLEAARDAFLEAAALAPGDLQARFNLEWTQRALTAEPPPPPPGPPRAAEDAAEEQERPEPEPGSPPAPETRAESTRQADSPPPAPRPEQRPPELTPEEIARWLERTRDDPRHALRSLRSEEREHRGAEW